MPSWEDAERPGNRMFEYISRYRDKIRKLQRAERASIKRAENAGHGMPNSSAREARRELEEAVYHCRYACTPSSTPVRLVPPGRRPQQVEYVQSALADENLRLQQSNAALKRLESEAIIALQQKLAQKTQDVTSSVATEHRALVELDAQRVKSLDAASQVQHLTNQVKDVVKDAKARERELKGKLAQKEKEVVVLGAKVARAHADLSQEMQSSERKKQRILQMHEREKAADSERIKQVEECNMRMQEMYLEKEKMSKVHEGKCLRLEARVTKLNVEMCWLQRDFQQSDVSA